MEIAHSNEGDHRLSLVKYVHFSGASPERKHSGKRIYHMENLTECLYGIVKVSSCVVEHDSRFKTK